MKTLSWNRFAGFDALAHAEDLVCLSRIRWQWTDSRLRALLAMAAQQWRVFFVEITPPAWLHPIDQRDQPSARAPVVRIASTTAGVWTVRPALTRPLAGNAHDTALTVVLDRFFTEAGVHDPVFWHLDACAPRVSSVLPAWVTLYLKPDARTWTCFDARERAGDAALRERADGLIDASVLSQSADAGWRLMCGEIMRVACQRIHAPVAQRIVA